MTTYKADEDLRRKRIVALTTAKHHVGRNYTDRDAKMAAAEELLAYQAFTAVQIAEWLGLSPWALEGKGGAAAWGVSALNAEQLEIAVMLAECGLEGTKPKTLIYEAHTVKEMSFDMIGGLLGTHKNTVRRIVRRIEGEPWT
ncbi:hypothetical protein [Frigoribacterium sp. CG_9.8]|uniref:hypothetical protein n=1 Tax=Frigoribacterium sp. CG_9.8 TaxID=2787733 RepID=UPI0018CBD0E5|nr:hypothetical protein [Frigoribacterium sp. CG_9.8]MBG6106620.1 hypothetical protein [Frigoribacterium sp. CG_9.8]